MSTAIYWNFVPILSGIKPPLTPLSPCRKLVDGWRDSDNSDTRLLSSLPRILATHTDPHQDIIWGHRRLLSLSSFRANSTINIKFYSCLTGSMKSMQFCSHFPLFSGQHHRCGHLRWWPPLFVGSFISSTELPVFTIGPLCLPYFASMSRSVVVLRSFPPCGWGDDAWLHWLAPVIYTAPATTIRGHNISRAGPGPPQQLFHGKWTDIKIFQ